MSNNKVRYIRILVAHGRKWRKQLENKKLSTCVILLHAKIQKKLTTNIHIDEEDCGFHHQLEGPQQVFHRNRMGSQIRLFDLA